jgi:hypothetical protein
MEIKSEVGTLTNKNDCFAIYATKEIAKIH